jgi:hypothetical protein
MVDGDCAFMIDIAAVFFDYFRVEGWFQFSYKTRYSSKHPAPSACRI